jgi:hypothetical protein
LESPPKAVYALTGGIAAPALRAHVEGYRNATDLPDDFGADSILARVFEEARSTARAANGQDGSRSRKVARII